MRDWCYNFLHIIIVLYNLLYSGLNGNFFQIKKYNNFDIIYYNKLNLTLETSVCV